MIASLGMYDRAEAQPANDRLWALIRDGMRAQGIAAPDGLTRGDGAFWSAWQAPDLVLSQTCGYPYRARLHGKVTLIGTPDYGVDRCQPGYYRSVFVARRNDRRVALADFDGAAFAFNEDLSQSGWAGPQIHAGKLGLRLIPRLRTGGHMMSARAVAEGRADIAGIDAVTWAMLRRWAEFAQGLKVIGETEPAPGLPCIAALGVIADTTFDCVTRAIANLSPDDRNMLSLHGFVRIPAETYLAMPSPPSPSALGLPD